VWRSATPSPLTAPAPCIIHALLLLVLEGELRCHFSLLFAPPAPLVQASTAAFGLVVRSCGRAVAVYLLSCSLGLGSLFTHSYGAVYELAVVAAFLAPLPPLPLQLIPVHFCAALPHVYCYSLFRLYVSGCLSCSFLVGSFAGSMLGKRGLSFTNDRVVAASRVGGCVAKGSVPSVCA